MIELIDVWKSFQNRDILQGMSFKVKKGETFVIIGLSGTGKTVSLKHIAGFLEPDKGEVLVDGVNMNGASTSVKVALRHKMGMVFQSGALLNWMDVEGNVSLPLVERRKLSKEEIQKAVDDKLRILQLYGAKEKYPADISGGMKKRACLARVLVRNPEIILYDEPTSGLDPIMSNVINILIRQMQAEFEVTSIVVTHDMNSAYYIADRIAFIYDGKIVECDTPENIKNSKNPYVSQFINGKLNGPIKID